MEKRRISINRFEGPSVTLRTHGTRPAASAPRVSDCIFSGRILLALVVVAGFALPAFGQANSSKLGSNPPLRPLGLPRQGLSREAYMRSTGMMDPALTNTPLNRIGIASSMDGLGLSREFSSGYHTWFQPEVVIRRQKAGGENDGEDEGLDAMAGQRSLNEMAEHYMSSRMQLYFTDGWRYFQDGDYRRAYEMFSLADRISSSEPEQRALVKLSQLHAAMAQEQYSVAAHALLWLLRPDLKTQRLVDPLFLLRIDDLPGRYVSRDKFEEDIQRIVAVARQSAEEVSQRRTPGLSDREQRRMAAQIVAPVRALAATMLWYRSRNEGEFYARSQLAGDDAVQPWSNLPELMKLAMEEDRRQPGAMSSGFLPPRGRTEIMMPWHPSPESGSSER